MVSDLKIHSIVGHRNGISGIGFYAVSLTYSDSGDVRSAIATVSYNDVQSRRDGARHDPDTRVLMIRRDCTGLDLTETMRGDWFHEDLCDALIKHEDAEMKKMRKETRTLRLKDGRRAVHM